MTPSDVGRLLEYASGLDDRLSGDLPTRRARVAAWSDQLAGVPYEFAREIAGRWYATEQPKALTPGILRDRWAARPEARERPELPTGPGVPMPPELRALIRGGRQGDPGDLAAIRTVACPWPPCSAPIGRRCTTHDGTRDVDLEHPHPSRVELARACA